jgi:molybdopterin molybdotransferase
MSLSPGRRAPVSVEVARREVLAAMPRLPAESRPVDGRLAGRVLAADVVARFTLPPFDNSAMDGYAVLAADVSEVPIRLPVVGEMAAGMAPGAVAIGPGTCAKVMTGAPMPSGADTVVPYEWTDRGDREVLIRERPRLGEWVRRAGEDLRPGELAIPAGTRLRPTDLAPLAASGLAEVAVARPPRVALLTTGDEIRPPGTELGPGAIYDTAGPALEAQILAAGGDLVARLRLGDEPEALEREMRSAAASADLLVTVGGVSVGDRDYVRATVERVGTLQLWRVAMRPGRPIALGQLEGAVFLGLPGNPVSANVTFILFGAPGILAMQGATHPGPVSTPAQLLERVDKPEGLETFHRGILERRPGALPGVRVAGNQSSGATLSLARADVIMVLPREGDSVAAGSVVEVIRL